jgi:hypothetical protein
VNHVVVAQDAGGFVARVQCIVCNSDHKYQKTGIAAKTGVRVTRPRASSGGGNYLKLMEEARTSAKNKVPVPYGMNDRFEAQTLIRHPVLGEGVVLKVMDSKIEVIFSDGIKLLVHNKAV